MNKALSSLQTLVSNDILTSYQTLKASLALPDSQLLTASEYALFNGGKRLRPLLLRLVAETVEADIEDAKVCELAIELMHSYSLVHDDLPAMDDDELRRGKPTVHIAYDEATAILVGDALQTLAFECLSEMPLSQAVALKRHELISILAKASGLRGMCLGQSLDLSATATSISADELVYLHQHKTGALLKAAVNLGTCLQNKLSEQERALFSDFAEAIGLAFQIQDDILDVIADTQTLGKPQGSDQSLNKSTFVSFYGLEGAKRELQKKLDLAIQCLTQLEYNTDTLEAFAHFMVSRTF